MLGLALALLFIGLNGFFVAAEFALVKLRATRASATAPLDTWREKLVRSAVGRLDRYLGVTQLGITLSSLGLGWIGEPAIARIGEELALRLVGEPLSPTSRGAIFGIAFVLLTLAHVLFGELVPKLLAIQRSREAALAAVPLLRLIELVLTPGLWILEFASRAVLKMVGLPFDAYGEAAMSEEEILGILAANVARTPRGQHKQELLRRVMRFADRTAKTAMIPRVDVAALPIETHVTEAIEFVRQQQYSRVLLVKGSSLDEVAGYLYVKDLAFSLSAHTLPNLERLRRDVLFVPEAQGLMEALRRMQRAHTPFAVVVDEYGGTSGIITMEDLLEEIVGEISDETDVEASRIEKNGDGWDVDGSTTFEELAALGMDPGGDDRAASLGALVLEKLQRIPRLGDRVELGNITAEVLTISRRRVTRLRIRPATKQELVTI